jgi:hypothetical protein
MALDDPTAVSARRIAGGRRSRRACDSGRSKFNRADADEHHADPLSTTKVGRHKPQHCSGTSIGFGAWWMQCNSCVPHRGPRPTCRQWPDAKDAIHCYKAAAVAQGGIGVENRIR